ncbi:hypothetical protein C6Q18_17755 [Pseudomonas chlororaphis subsp. piscium]|nr:hypothetical protein C6Q18_17755 [Pseudomonas chlororaphis subsp. piscium]
MALSVEDYRSADRLTVFVLQLHSGARRAGNRQLARGRIDCPHLRFQERSGEDSGRIGFLPCDSLGRGNGLVTGSRGQLNFGLPFAAGARLAIITAPSAASPTVHQRDHPPESEGAHQPQVGITPTL